MICEVTLAVMSVGFTLEKLVELRMLSSIKRSGSELLKEVKANGLSAKQSNL